MSEQLSFENFSRKPGRRLLILLGLLAILLPIETHARVLKFHGPVIQWYGDPTTEASFSWIEEVEPDTVETPAWRKGGSGFGYGDDDDVTRLDAMKGQYSRVYLAKEFQVASVPSDAELHLGMRYDDAFVVFINGREAFRSDNIAGVGSHAEVTKNHEAGAEETFTLADAGRFLRRGGNLISVEGHNARLSSSDFTLEPRLLLGGKKLIGAGEEWHYLAGGDPPPEWNRSMPGISRIPEPAMEKDSKWALQIRRRGWGGGFQTVKHSESDFGKSGDTAYRAKVKGLLPDTAYEFALVAGGMRVKSGWFRTAPRVLSRPMHFIVGGDMGTDGAVPMSRAVGRENPLFVAVGGDLAYANGRAHSLWYDWIDNWCDLVIAPDGRSIPIVVAIGNHETKSFSGLKKQELWKGLFSLRTKKSRAPLFFSLFDLPYLQRTTMTTFKYKIFTRIKVPMSPFN